MSNAPAGPTQPARPLFSTTRTRMAAGLAALMTLGAAPVFTSAALGHVGDGRSVEVDYGIDMVIVGGKRPVPPSPWTCSAGGPSSAPSPATRSATVRWRFTTWGRRTAGTPPTPDIQPGDTIRARQGTIEDSTVARDIFIDNEDVRYDAPAGTITVQGHARSATGAPIDPANDVLSILLRFPIDVNPVPPSRTTPSDSDQSARSDRIAADIGDELRADGTFTHTFDGFSPADIEAIEEGGPEVIAEWGGGGTATVDPNELTVYSGQQGPLTGCPPFAPADQEAPSTPTELTSRVLRGGATATTGTVTLSWTASTDNDGVTGYRIKRDGAVVGTTRGTESCPGPRTPRPRGRSRPVSAAHAAGCGPPRP